MPSDWSSPDSGTNDVFYALLPAQTGPSEGTVIPFMGGPGESITDVIGLFVPLSDAVVDRDILIVDVRGAGRSGALTGQVSDEATEFASAPPGPSCRCPLGWRCAQPVHEVAGDLFDLRIASVETVGPVGAPRGHDDAALGGGVGAQHRVAV